MPEQQQPVRATVPNATEVAVATFHLGAHPQRPIPQDLTDAEKVALDRERSNIHATNRVPMEEPGTLPGEAAGSGPLIPGFRPAAGRLYTGPSAAEELALRGIDPALVEAARAEPDPEAEAARAEAEERAAAERNARRSAPEQGPEPDMPAGPWELAGAAPEPAPAKATTSRTSSSTSGSTSSSTSS